MKIFVAHRLILAGLMASALSACGTVPERNPVPQAHAETARIPGIPEARGWADTIPANVDERVEHYKELIGTPSPEWTRNPAFLAMSGGGANGAFGAGFLVGWTATGNRPEFMTVTGISTGALIAPFAFMGPEYDEKLEEVYTSTSTKDIIRKRSFLTAVTSDALTDTEPLKRLLQKHFDGKFLEDFVNECSRGRGLFIVTSNLDSGRPVEWRLCDIAMSGQPNALELIQQVILASASIPGWFPPVIVEVETEDGQRYDEMHVDGGATAQVTLFVPDVDLRGLLEGLGIKGTPSVYVIRNSSFKPRWVAVEASLGAIIKRSIGSLINYQGVGDIYRIYLAAQKDGADFNLAYIPESFEDTSEEPFDPVYMQALFDLGYQMAIDGYAWTKTPIELASPSQ